MFSSWVTSALLGLPGSQGHLWITPILNISPGKQNNRWTKKSCFILKSDLPVTEFVRRSIILSVLLKHMHCSTQEKSNEWAVHIIYIGVIDPFSSWYFQARSLSFFNQMSSFFVMNIPNQQGHYKFKHYRWFSSSASQFEIAFYK